MNGSIAHHELTTNKFIAHLDTVRRDVYGVRIIMLLITKMEKHFF